METSLAFKIRFRDHLGKDVTVGDKIRIDHHYTYSHLNGKEATVIWNQEWGRYEWTFTETRRKKTFTTTESFCGVHQFTKL